MTKEIIAYISVIVPWVVFIFTYTSITTHQTKSNFYKKILCLISACLSSIAVICIGIFNIYSQNYIITIICCEWLIITGYNIFCAYLLLKKDKQ